MPQKFRNEAGVAIHATKKFRDDDVYLIAFEEKSHSAKMDETRQSYRFSFILLSFPSLFAKSPAAFLEKWSDYEGKIDPS